MSTAPQRSTWNIFFSRLEAARASVLFLDYDGTIAPFVADRARAFPYPDIPELLDAILSTRRTRVIFVTGRPAHEIPALYPASPCPEIWGCHGLEQVVDGQVRHVDVLDTEVRGRLATTIEGLLRSGLDEFLEVKPGSVAIHLRGLSEARRNDVRSVAEPLLAAGGVPGRLMLREFDGGLELRVVTPNKGNVVRNVLADLAANVPVAYLGDDGTDEDAFVALNGRGLSVLVRAEYRATAAQMWIRPPEELKQFLVDWLRATGGEL